MTADLSWIEYAVIVGYLGVLLSVGFVIRRFSSNDSDYFRNGCRGTWWLVGASAFMQIFSAWTFTGAAGAAFEAGWSVMVIFGANAACFLLIFLFLGPWFRQLRAVTAPEIIRERFGAGTQQFYAWLQAILGLLQASIWLWGLATFTAAVFDLTSAAEWFRLSEVQLIVVITGLIVLGYSVAGGSWAVMATDVLQGLILLPLTILVALLALQHIGGVGAMFDEIEAQGLERRFAVVNPSDPSDPDAFPLGKYGLMFAVAWSLYKIVSFSTLTTAQKYFGVKDGNEARKAGLLACVLMLAGMFVWFVPPVVARLTMADDVLAIEMSKPEEGSYALIASRLLPTGMVGLMVVAMLSATMSSMDSGLNRNAAVFVRDIIPPIRRLLGMGEMSDRVRMIFAQLFSIGLGITIIAIALYFSGVDGKGVFEWMLQVGALLALPMAVPLFMGLFVRSVPAWSAIVAVVITLIPSAISSISKLSLADDLAARLGIEGTWAGSLITNDWSYQQTVLTNTTIGVVVFMLTSLAWRWTSSSYRVRVAGFFKKMHTPVDFREEVGDANDRDQLRLVGAFAICVGAAISALALPPGHTLTDRLGILFVGGTVLGVGLLMRFAASRQNTTGTRDPSAPPTTTSNSTAEPDSTGTPT